MLALLAAAAALAAPCDLNAPPDAPFTVAPSAEAAHVQVIVEVWADGSDPAWARGVLGALADRDLRGTLVVPVDRLASTAVLDLADAARDAGHEVAVRLSADVVPRDVRASLRPFRSRLKPLRKAVGPVRTAVTPLPGRASEALLGKAGLLTLLPVDSPATAAPRWASTFEDEPQTRVVLPAGPYDGPCGADPGPGPFTPRAADRASQAIHAAARGQGARVVRVVLKEAHGADTDARVLGRWIDEVLLEAGISVTTPSRARLAAMKSLRSSTAPPPEAPPSAAGRILDVEAVREAARALEGVQILPASLPGEVSLAEAFQAFVILLAEGAPDGSVRLVPMQGPRGSARSVLGQDEVVEVPRDEVIALARRIAAERPDAAPIALRAGSRLLTAPELLGLFASAVRGDEPCVTRISASPDPNATGQGW